MATSDELKAPAGPEVPMIDADEVRQIRELRRQCGERRASPASWASRATVRRYVRRGDATTRSWRPGARALDEEMRRRWGWTGFCISGLGCIVASFVQLIEFSDAHRPNE